MRSLSLLLVAAALLAAACSGSSTINETWQAGESLELPAISFDNSKPCSTELVPELVANDSSPTRQAIVKLLCEAAPHSTEHNFLAGTALSQGDLEDRVYYDAQNDVAYKFWLPGDPSKELQSFQEQFDGETGLLEVVVVTMYDGKECVITARYVFLADSNGLLYNGVHLETLNSESMLSNEQAILSYCKD